MMTTTTPSQTHRAAALLQTLPSTKHSAPSTGSKPATRPMRPLSARDTPHPPFRQLTHTHTTHPPPPLCTTPCTVGVDRQGLTAFLVDEATRRYSPPPPAASHNNTEAEAEAEGGTTKGAITFHFNTTPHINLQQRRVSCVPAAAAETAGVSSKDSSQEQQQRQHSAAAATATATTPRPPPPSIELQYDLLVGADGAGSTVRTLLEQALPQHVQVDWTDGCVLGPGGRGRSRRRQQQG